MFVRSKDLDSCEVYYGLWRKTCLEGVSKPKPFRITRREGGLPPPLVPYPSTYSSTSMTITWIDDNDDIIADIVEILEKYIESSKDRNKKDIDYIYILTRSPRSCRPSLPEEDHPQSACSGRDHPFIRIDGVRDSLYTATAQAKLRLGFAKGPLWNLFFLIKPAYLQVNLYLNSLVKQENKILELFKWNLWPCHGCTKTMYCYEANHLLLLCVCMIHYTLLLVAVMFGIGNLEMVGIEVLCPFGFLSILQFLAFPDCMSRNVVEFSSFVNCDFDSTFRDSLREFFFA